MVIELVKYLHGESIALCLIAPVSSFGFFSNKLMADNSWWRNELSVNLLPHAWLMFRLMLVVAD